MITGALKSKIDKLWLDFHTGGITNPLTVIEQISFLLFARMLDMREVTAEKRAGRTQNPDWKRIFPEHLQYLRWSHLIQLPAEEQLRIVQGNRNQGDPPEWKGLFQFFREDVVNGTTLGHYLRDAQCVIQKPGLLKTAMNAVHDLPLHIGDTKGDLYEYLLSKLTTAGVAGQFRTPRHVIRAMVEMLDIQPTETICDPACGTVGFLIESLEYLKRTHSSPELIREEIDAETGKPLLDDHGNPVRSYPGDQLEEYREHIDRDMFNGFDFDSTMLRIAAMNMMLHGIENPAIAYKDSLSEQSRVAQEYAGHFDVVLANPPFKGSLDLDSVYKGLTAVTKTKKTELLFLVLIEQILKKGGRCGVVVPDGVLFGNSTAHLAVRRMIIENNQLDGVISLPSGVFRPYAGVSTAILLFTKAGKTKDVFFYKVSNDGYSLDDKRTPIKDDDLPDLVEKWRARDPKKMQDRTRKAFFVPLAELEENNFDLSHNRYAEATYEAEEYDPPKVILKRMKDLETEILADLNELEEMLG